MHAQDATEPVLRTYLESSVPLRRVWAKKNENANSRSLIYFGCPFLSDRISHLTFISAVETIECAAIKVLRRPYAKNSKHFGVELEILPFGISLGLPISESEKL